MPLHRHGFWPTSFVLLLIEAGAMDNGLARTPPMGWRSWNLYGANVNQQLIESIMDGMVSRKRSVDGRPTSLCDLGYCNVGLDDAWQDCGAGNSGYKYHIKDSAGNFAPVVKTDRFPSLKAMTDRAHTLGLTAGWYANNCICRELEGSPSSLYAGDVRALVDYGFDGLKLDDCGSEKDLNLWASLLNASGKDVVIENCHWGFTVPTKNWCPWHFFRTSSDIRASYASVVRNLLSTVHWAKSGLSRPGCWAYPDMLEVGCQHGPGGASDPGLSPSETRAHFGAWAIVSSPLTLSMDVNNDTIMDQAWPLISNPEAIAINQAWAGHSGSPFKESWKTILLGHERALVEKGESKEPLPPGGHGPLKWELLPVLAPAWQFYQKPLGSGKVAVLLMNNDSKGQDLTLAFSDVPGLQCQLCFVRDVWLRQDRGLFQGHLTEHVASHDAAFVVLSDPALQGKPELHF